MPAYNKTTSAAVLRLIPSSSPVSDISWLKFPDSPQTSTSPNQIPNKYNASESEQVVSSLRVELSGTNCELLLVAQCFTQCLLTQVTY